MHSLVHYYSGQQADVVNAWLENNPSFVNTGENAARIAARVGRSVTAASLDAAWNQVKANPKPAENPDGAQALYSALRARIEGCPIQGSKVQMLSALDSLAKVGGPWLWSDGRDERNLTLDRLDAVDKQVSDAVSKLSAIDESLKSEPIDEAVKTLDQTRHHIDLIRSGLLRRGQ